MKFFLLVIKSIIVPFYSLHACRVINKAATGTSQDNNLNFHRPLSKMLLPAKKTMPIKDSLILLFFFHFIL